MERTHICGGCGSREDVGYLVDATIAALQAMNNRLGGRVETLEAQLTQRTAELAAAKKVKADYDRWLSGGVYFTTAEYMAHIDEHRAELERVSLLSSHNERRFEEVDKKYKELRALILALPKVEGEIEVWDHDNGLMFTCLTRPVSRYALTFRSSEERDAYAALLQHRQGMEG